LKYYVSMVRAVDVAYGSLNLGSERLDVPPLLECFVDEVRPVRHQVFVSESREDDLEGQPFRVDQREPPPED
jgi:hypothetical protein